MTLTIQDLGALGELLGSVAVLVTLGYLALQTRQNTIAIGAQLDATRIQTNQAMTLTNATSTAIQEALAEDRIDDRTINESRRHSVWASEVFVHQWNFLQARRGLLPSWNGEAVLARLDDHFTSYRSYEAWWEFMRPRFFPEFVEWVEEQRSKAA
jgi:hypothetical protein